MNTANRLKPHLVPSGIRGWWHCGNSQFRYAAGMTPAQAYYQWAKALRDIHGEAPRF